MTIHDDFNAPVFDVAGIVTDIRRLTANCSGPMKLRAQLRDWAATLQTDVEAALKIETLKDAIGILILLSHANAGFSLAPTPPGHDGPPEPVITDAGGYFHAQTIIMEIVKTAPLSRDCRIELLQHILVVARGQIAQIVDLLVKR